jgi:hypothetical protein
MCGRHHQVTRLLVPAQSGKHMFAPGGKQIVVVDPIEGALSLRFAPAAQEPGHATDLGAVKALVVRSLGDRMLRMSTRAGRPAP